MKREHVIPDLLASMTADALFGKRTQSTLDDDWAGGWYARTRQLQAATLAHVPKRTAGAANATSGTAESDGATVTVDVLTQVKDFS